MNAVGADQDVAAHRPGMGAGAIEEMRRDAAFILAESPQPAAGVDRLPPQPLLDGAVDHALQPAAMNRELWDVVAGIDAAGLAPDFLTVAVEVVKHVGADRDIVEPLQQAEAGELADRMRQRIDADAEFADGIGLFEQLAADAARPQHQRGGKAADTATDDNRLHRPQLHERHATVVKLA